MARKKVTRAQTLMIAKDKLNGMSLKDIAKKHKLSFNQVSYIVYGKANKPSQESLVLKASLWERLKRWFG